MISRGRSKVLLALLGALACRGEPDIGFLDLQLVTDRVFQPVVVTAPPGDPRLFIAEQNGAIRVVRDTLLQRPFLDLTAEVACCGERGLLGLAFHPQFAANGWFYVSWTDATGIIRVTRHRAAPGSDTADAARLAVLSQSHPEDNHHGGTLAFGGDGYLYIGLGDGGGSGDPAGNAQDLNTRLGKILRVDVDGGSPYVIPPTNPFLSQPARRPEIWAYGLRSPRFSFDRETGQLYLTDAGQGARSEINVEPDGNGGHNYGWNTMDGSDCVSPGCQVTGLALPLFDMPNNPAFCPLTGGVVYRGAAIPEMRGHYLFADYCRGTVHSLKLENGTATDHQDRFGLEPGGPLSGLGEDGFGELYVIQLSPVGAVYRAIRNRE